MSEAAIGAASSQAPAMSEAGIGAPASLAPTTGRPSIRRMLLSASATAVLQGVSNAVGFVLSVLLARLLGASGYGVYALGLAWASFLAIPAILGLDRFLVRGIATYEVHEQWSLMRGLLRRTNQLVLVTSTILAVIAAGVGFVALGSSLRTPFCVAMILIPITNLTMLRQGAMQAIGRVLSGQLPEYLIRPFLILAGVLVLELAGHGALTATTALAANVTGVAVAFTVGAILLKRALPHALRSVAPRYVTREWLRASLPMMLIAGVWLANSYAGILVVGTLQGARAAGVYTVVQKGAELIVVLLAAVNMPLSPAIARLHARGDRAGLEHTTERMARATLYVSAPLALAFALLPNVYLSIFGSGFRSGSTALVVLAIGQLINAAAGPSGTVLIMTGQERVAVRGVAAGLIANVVLAVALVPPLGVTGGAIAFASSLMIWNTILVVLGRRRVGINVTAFRRFAMCRDASHEQDA
jgi:O-antigen/teichoic acid export membrane protein